MMMTTVAKRSKRKRPASKRKRPRRRLGVRNAEGIDLMPSAEAVSAAASEQTTFNRLGYTAAGWGGAAIVGALAARLGYRPRTIAVVLGAAGAVALAKAKDKDVQSLGAGAFGAGGSQLVLQSFPPNRDVKPDDKPKDAPKQDQQPPQPQSQPQGRQAAFGGSLAPGALDAAFERARAAVALDADGHGHEHDHDRSYY